MHEYIYIDIPTGLFLNSNKGIGAAWPVWIEIYVILRENVIGLLLVTLKSGNLLKSSAIRI